MASKRHAPAAPSTSYRPYAYEGDLFAPSEGEGNGPHDDSVPFDSYGSPAGYGGYGGYGGHEEFGGFSASGSYDPSAKHDVHGMGGVYDMHAPHEAQSPEEKYGRYASQEAYGPRGDEPWEEWNPTEDSVRPVRGRHRVGKQRGGMARSSAVLGVGMIAAVGAGGMATAKDKDPGSISVPDLANSVKELPAVGDLVGGADKEAPAAAQAPLTSAGVTADEAEAGQTDAGEALRSRILKQAEQQQGEADSAARQKAADEAREKAAAKAEENADAERKAEAERKREIEEKKKKKEEAERRAKLARSYTAPLSSYQLSAGFGQSGGMWQSDHTGQDFSASAGTPVKAIHSGTIKEAGWAGSYGYRVVLELDDGTELSFSHLSSMTKSAGDKVTTGDVIARVGSTGNSSGPHLHLEVCPGGGDPIDPMPWLRDKGVNI